jgi:hypothetical protein
MKKKEAVPLHGLGLFETTNINKDIKVRRGIKLTDQNGEVRTGGQFTHANGYQGPKLSSPSGPYKRRSTYRLSSMRLETRPIKKKSSNMLWDMKFEPVMSTKQDQMKKGNNEALMAEESNSSYTSMS